ncbi:hypothetical protein [Demequina lignilytica]|uniref:Uncharacterized protein n=1 Tax=Demequina lignilytica TaxID=3051663 RepID=A0AAW7M2N4_9MICO|nr:MULTISPECIES: hypothetical protein [unclassified Demequina]MDN4477067.1 hypothetical protein [Demequina sp. SYSU T00039-1]MDN4483915.1 hypothetical protein [Demequina sp. SYSU T0a273]MDN4487240.1 hypothetical protein [Demequina sp. SYSU T00039]MDN4491491.1 hypothetical protein [Demequina sp. SYSU T00068]
MAVASERIIERAQDDFGATAAQVLTRLERLGVGHEVDAERVQAAVLLVARGNRVMLDDALEHARDDWRDLLDRAGLAGEGWRARLDEALGLG